MFNRDQLLAMGCGGMIGVNQGSTEPPRMVKLTYSPRNPVGHLTLVGKGVMYDSGGISLKPSDGMHAMMKMDMSGAAAVLGAMTALKGLRCKAKVTGYLMCTDNMPSGSAMKLGDVLTFRNGKTAEIHNTDAEGRLVLADGLSLAVEEQPDADRRHRHAHRRLRRRARSEDRPGWSPTTRRSPTRCTAAGRSADETLWQLPLAKEYRKLLDSNVADMKNVGGPYGGVITASLFLSRVRRRHAVGAPRHRRPDARRRRRRLVVARCDRVRHAHLDRARHRVCQAGSLIAAGTGRHRRAAGTAHAGRMSSAHGSQRCSASAARRGGTPIASRWCSATSGSSPPPSSTRAIAVARASINSSGC